MVTRKRIVDALKSAMPRVRPAFKLTRRTAPPGGEQTAPMSYLVQERVAHQLIFPAPVRHLYYGPTSTFFQ
eukprot:1158221-Pelagomonas_calceolata.AAC.6